MAGMAQYSQNAHKLKPSLESPVAEHRGTALQYRCPAIA